MFQLHVKVVETKDLAKMDSLDDSDPYCILKVNGTEQKTSNKSNTLSPTWNEEFHFDVENANNGTLEILMKDKDGGLNGKDDEMATLSVPFHSCPVGKVVDNWYDMTPCQKGKKGGQIHLILNMLPKGATPFTTEVPSGHQQHGGHQQGPPQNGPKHEGHGH